MLKTFKQVIQYESSKLCNYEFMKIKNVDEKLIKKAKLLYLSNFSNVAPKKRGRKKKETLPKALERSPDATKIQNLRRSQRSKK